MEVSFRVACALQSAQSRSSWDQGSSQQRANVVDIRGRRRLVECTSSLAGRDRSHSLSIRYHAHLLTFARARRIAVSSPTPANLTSRVAQSLAYSFARVLRAVWLPPLAWQLRLPTPTMFPLLEQVLTSLCHPYNIIPVQKLWPGHFVPRRLRLRLDPRLISIPAPRCLLKRSTPLTPPIPLSKSPVAAFAQSTAMQTL